MRTRLAFCAALWIAVGVSLNSIAAEPTVAAKIQEQIAAGEFAPAVELAQRVADGPQRDQLLATIAKRQQEAGEWKAAIYTTSEIDDESLRGKTYQQMKSQPPARGGAGQADFDPLIELITSTVKPMSWEAAGGPGNVKGFESGVYVDAAGVLKMRMQPATSADDLAEIRALGRTQTGNSDLRRKSPLRKVSLNQLERQVQRLLAAGEKVPDEMLMLAGLQRIQYVLLYPESGDVVLAGPAGDWTRDKEGRMVSVDNQHPIVQLNDLVVVLRHTLKNRDGAFGCSIDPTNEGLKKAQAYIQETGKTPLKQGQAPAWLKQIGDRLGPQNVTTYGVDSRTRVGQVLVEADYRMKRIGLGLEEGVLGCPSFLASIQMEKGKPLPPMSMVRWWFTLNYDAIRATKDRNAFGFRGQGVQLQSENEFLNAQGQREHTGDADAFNKLFAQNFTKHFVSLAKKYALYADLQNVFDLALVAALLKSEDVPNRLHWRASCFLDPEQYPVPLTAAPKIVETVINHRIINQVQVVAAVSGGVRVDPDAVVKKESITVEERGEVWGARYSGERGARPKAAWWWD